MLEPARRQRLRVQVIGLRPLHVARRDTRGNQPVVTRAIFAPGGKLNLDAVFQVKPDNLVQRRTPPIPESEPHCRQPRKLCRSPNDPNDALLDFAG